jgi:capsular polysaccharide biosynthesis protein
MDEMIREESNSSSFFSFDKRILLLSLRKKIIVILLGTLLVSFVAAIWAKLSIKSEWRATSILIRNPKNFSSSSEIPYLYQQFDLETIIESFATRQNLEEVIDSLQLDISYRQLFSHISINRGRKSNVIHISAVHRKRDIAVKIANHLSNVVIKNYTKILNSPTEKIYQYYLEQRTSYESELSAIQEQIRSFQEIHGMISPETESHFKYEQLAELQLELIKTQMNITALQTRITDIDVRLAEMPERVAIGYSITSTKEGKLREFKDEFVILRKKYTDENPKIIQLKHKISEMEKEISNTSEQTFLPDIVNYGEGPVRENLLVNKAQFETELIASREQILDYEKKISILRKELQSLTSLENEFYQIKSQESLIKNLIETIDNRLVEAKISMGSNVSDLEILQTAIPPETPEGSGRKVIVLAFGFLTFFGLTLFFAGKEFLDFSVKSEFDYEHFLKIKLAGEIPNKDEINPVVFHSQTQLLFGQVQALLPPKEHIFIALGSDKTGTGKTFIAHELIELFMQYDKNVLFIETIAKSEPEIEPNVINPFLYDGSKELKCNQITNQFSKAYFIKSEKTLRYVLKPEMLQSFLTQFSQFDIIIWELFEFNFNMQLFSSIAKASDLLLFVSRFKKSSRTQLTNAITFLNQEKNISMAGILNDTEKPFFKTKF